MGQGEIRRRNRSVIVVGRKPFFRDRLLRPAPTAETADQEARQEDHGPDDERRDLAHGPDVDLARIENQEEE